MTSKRHWTELAVRLAGGALAVAGLGFCHVLAARPLVASSASVVFFLVVTVCGALALFARGLGGWAGAGLGGVTGLSLSIALTQQVAAPVANQIGFALVATGVLGLVGYLSGCRTEKTPTEERTTKTLGAERVSDARENRRHLAAHADGPTAPRVSSTGGLSAEEAIGAVLSEFCLWLERNTAASRDADRPLWPVFDQFVREVLRDRISASGVRVFRVLPDGEQLEPIAQGASQQTISARAGLVGHVTTTGRVYVADDPYAGVLIEELAHTEAGLAGETPTPPPGDTGAEQGRRDGRWAWLLPLQMHNHAVGLIAVGRVAKPGFGALTMAHAVRDALQLCWRHVLSLEALSQFRCTDRQSGLLDRAELLKRLPRVAHASTRDGEPVMVLALAVEGLRGLDDARRWALRDDVIRRLGRALRARVRSDDLLGRFSDERFVVVLRRLDSALGALVAGKLMETVRNQVLTELRETDAAENIRIRGGLAGSGLQAVDAEALLERALDLVDAARSQGIELADDIGEPQDAAGRATGAGNGQTAVATPVIPQACDAAAGGTSP